MSVAPAHTDSSSNGRLGTFAGVFTPSILTILGIIRFRRLGYVVGGAGLTQTLWIILLSSGIAILFQRVRESLLAMSEDPEHPHDWRPCVLVFCDDPARRARIDDRGQPYRGGGRESAAIARQSRQGAASLVFFPLRFRELGLLTAMGDQVNVAGFVKRLPIVALTLAAEEIDLDAGPDEGKIAEIAAALDAAKDAEAIALMAEREALRLAQEAGQESASRGGQRSESGAQVDTKIGTSLQGAQIEAKTAAELAVEARQKAEQAPAAAAKIGIDTLFKK